MGLFQMIEEDPALFTSFLQAENIEIDLGSLQRILPDLA
jgi:hypothetical protein